MTLQHPTQNSAIALRLYLFQAGSIILIQDLETDGRCRVVYILLQLCRNMGNLQFIRGLFSSGAEMPEKVSEEEGGVVSQKIRKSMTYYTSVHIARDQKTLFTAQLESISGAKPPEASCHDALLSGTQPVSPPLAPRPLVLFLPWLGARPGAVAKYRSLYLQRGMDVLVVETGVMHFLWPRWGLRYGLEVLKVLEEPRFSGRPLLVHACSIGGYTFTQMLGHIAQGPEKYARLAPMIVGQIYDSMVVGTLEHMAIGLGKTLLPRLNWLVKNAALLYFWLFKSHTADYYDAGVQVFHHSPVTSPTLFFFCENDALCDPVALESVIDLWRERGVAVESRKWKVSRHAGHMRCHPDEYLSTLEKFLNALAPLQANI